MVRNWFKKREQIDEVVADLKKDGPVLKIIADKELVASLYKTGTDYCLEYTAAFLKSGLLPFNLADLEGGVKRPDISHVYKSKNLWPVFQERIPSPDRNDYQALMSSMGLTGAEDPLEILSRVGRISISKRWQLQE